VLSGSYFDDRDGAVKRFAGNLLSLISASCGFSTSLCLKGKRGKMSRSAVVMGLVVLSASFLFAQDATPKVQVFGGYSLFHADSGGLTTTTLYNALHEPNEPFDIASNFMGWNAEAQYNVNPWFGIAADFGGRYGAPLTQGRFSKLSGLPNGNGYTLMVGPVVTYRNKSRLTPFIHVLFGFDRLSISASTISGLSTPLSSTATTFDDAALALGGGLDLRVFRRFSLRLAQLDYLETTHNLDHFYGQAFPTGAFNNLETHERNLRVSSGIVIRF
jgi:hypothetical protein